MSADMTRHAEVLRLLQGALTDAIVADLAQRVLGDPAATVETWCADPVDYAFGTPTTKGAVRVRGVTADVAYGMDGALAIRSAFTALPLGRLTEPATAELDALIHNRLQLTRYLCDLGLALPLPS